MQYLLTQVELDELKNKPCVNVQEFLTKLGEHIVYDKVCVDITDGPIFVVGRRNFQKAVEKTIEYYVKSNS